MWPISGVEIGIQELVGIMTDEQKRLHFPPRGGFPILLRDILREKRRLHGAPIAQSTPAD